ncbi:MAG: tyrosine-type recombinase/integrase [Thermoplasmatota archaeon]
MRFKRDPIDLRPNVRWLDRIQVIRLLQEPMTPREEIIIHLSLGMSLRRSDIMRVHIDNIDHRNEWIHFESKPNVIRSVPFRPDTPRVIDMWMNERDNILEKGRGKEPKELVIGIKRQGMKLTGLKESALDNTILNIRNRLPFHFSFHDLRRTWARQAYEWGVEILAISMILGHRDTKTTLRYIGAPVDEMREAMNIVYQRRLSDLEAVEMIRPFQSDSLQSYRKIEEEV